MQASITANSKRIESIDILRGIVMVLMALDHVRDYFHLTADSDDPLNLVTTTPFLFFTRWITHFCAPVFVFLSGTSIYLQSLRKTKKELSVFLIKRGLWLIFVEVIIISLAWTFNPLYNNIPLQVIWAIGISMVILGLLIKQSFNLIFAIGLAIVCTHNLLDFQENSKDFSAGFFMDLIHSARFTAYNFLPNHRVIIVYPFLPWTGLMMLGYCCGKFFTAKYSSQKRMQILNSIGIGLILFFVVIRYLNVYGDPYPWAVQQSSLYTFFAFIKVHKYPPSLMYVCITIGPALLLLSFLEKIKNGFTNCIQIYGRVAFFYYVLHIYLIHLIAAIFFFAKGHSFHEGMGIGEQFSFYFTAANDGYGLGVVYLVWIVVVILLFPLCKWYNHYKSNHKEKWWLSYL